MIIVGADYHPAFQQIAFVRKAHMRSSDGFVGSFLLYLAIQVNRHGD